MDRCKETYQSVRAPTGKARETTNLNERRLDQPRETYQSEGAQNGQALDAAQHELDQTENDDDDVETVPLVFHILYRV